MTVISTRLAGIALLVVLPALGEGSDQAIQDDRVPAEPPISQLVLSFFQEEDPRVREKLTAKIEQSADSLEIVARAVQSTSLWSALSPREGVLPFESAAGETISITYRLPPGYDPDRPVPMVLCMPDDGATAADTLSLATAVLGESISGFALICPDRGIGGSFHQRDGTAGDFPGLMRMVRRRIHTDTDRVFLFGADQGGDAAWMAALGYPDWFAGAVILSGYPPLPYPEQVCPFLLENLRRVPVLAVWRSADDPRATARQKVASAHNRAIVGFARQVDLPIVGFELPSSGDVLGPAGRQQIRRIIGGRREPLPPEVHHWFRYASQGHAGWLRQTKYKGEVWEADQLSILPSPVVDRDAFIREVVQWHLAYLHGRIDGQTITIQARRSARVEVLLPDGLLDWSRPITVYCNGKKRHTRPVEPGVRTLLETAYQDWEFQRLVAARLSFSIRTDPP